MKNLGFLLLLSLVMLGYYGLVSAIQLNNTDAEPVAATASVYLLPMQQDTRVFTITAGKATVWTEPGGESAGQLGMGDRITANCDHSDHPGWCQVAEGKWKDHYFRLGCTDTYGGDQEQDECY